MEELTERKKLILKAVVEAYIESGEPIGSKTLVEKGAISFSSATIRNEMSELEELGYLEKPHTSSGRIPSEMGYRFYVDSLTDNFDVTNREIGELKSMLKTKQSELDSILDSAMKLASSITNYPAVAIRPHAKGLVVSRFEVVFINEKSLLLVLILNDGNINTKTLSSNVQLTPDVCTSLAAVLNRTLTNLSAEEITLPKMMSLEKTLGNYESLAAPIVKRIYEALDNNQTGDVKVEGVNRLLSYPEYANVDKLKGMLDMFEAKDGLVNIVSKEPNTETSDDIQVLIGHENPLGGLENSSLIFKPVKSGGKTVGAIGIIGPTRMDYPKVMAMLNNLTASVSELMADSGEVRSLESGDKNEGN